jgi:hypothetical protein
MTTTANATTIKLSDTQLVLLSQAAQHPERAATMPERIKGGAVQRVVGSLLAKGLVEAVPHRGDLPVYKVEADGSRLALVITDVGLLALGIEPEPVREASAPAAAPSELDAPAAASPEAAVPRPRQPRTDTKQAMVIEMLERPQGATVPEIMKATGWLPHTVRSAIAGAIKKKLGLAITTEKIDPRGRVYRVG